MYCSHGDGKFTKPGRETQGSAPGLGADSSKPVKCLVFIIIHSQIFTFETKYQNTVQFFITASPQIMTVMELAYYSHML